MSMLMGGVFRAGQQIHPETRIPSTKPPESLSDLERFNKEELQSPFDAIDLKDKEFETQRMQAALAGYVLKMNRINEAEHANSQLLINIAEALDRKGIKPLIPQSESFQGAVSQSTEARNVALKKLQEEWRTQRAVKV